MVFASMGDGAHEVAREGPAAETPHVVKALRDSRPRMDFLVSSARIWDRAFRLGSRTDSG